MLLLLAITLGALPGYWQGGNWRWSDLPEIANVEQMRNLRDSGINLERWQTTQQQEIPVGGNKWSVQVIRQNQSKPIVLLFLPQTYYLNKPYVEWLDINGLERWKTDSYSNLKVKLAAGNTVKARFFRAWNRQQTFAVIQWYAFPFGGHYSPTIWFLQDQLAQLRGRRVPWVAVSFRIPIEPLGEKERAIPQAQSLIREIQANLKENIFDVS
ncbi:MAG TPA: cyanoexosortase B system-associated protein [Xenococcaceae cyanobacterium]